MAMMRLGIIDLGTNSVRFDVQELGPGRRIHRLHREKRMIRLGQGVFLHGRLDRNAMRRTLGAFLRFRQAAEALGAKRIVAFATSALREATDNERLLGLIRRRAGIELRIISGEEEARLIARGILAHERVRRGRFALVDIGGGSTEISVCRGRSALRSASFDLGTSRLQQLFLRRSPPSRRIVRDLRTHIRTTLRRTIAAEGWPGASHVLGSSGTVRALAKILRKRGGGRTIERRTLSRLVSEMARMNPKDLARLPGIEPHRVDMILAGGILLEECMRALGAGTVAPTPYALRDGILEEERRRARSRVRGRGEAAQRSAGGVAAATTNPGTSGKSSSTLSSVLVP